jgi:tRNA threonylcarbamoyladenosine biosynthesis protein TsaB
VPAPTPLLVLDAGSPLVSVAVSRNGEVLAERSIELHRSSTQLLEMVRDSLAEAGLGLGDLGGLAALRGPGSFTGVRIGLATVLGLHQALGTPATALSTFEALAASVPCEGETVIAAVDALRGDWSAQAFAGGAALGEPELAPGPELPRLAGGRPAVVVGFGVSRLGEDPGWPADVRLAEAGPLAATAARLIASREISWDASLLTAALYSRPPAVTLPKPRR